MSANIQPRDCVLRAHALDLKHVVQPHAKNVENEKRNGDNMRPSCGYCLQHHIQCVYSDDGIAAPWDEVGERVLQAIDQLSGIVKQQRCASCLRGVDDAAHVSYRAIASQSPLSHGTQYAATSPEIERNESDTVGELLDGFSVKAQGTDSILTWPILEGFRSPDCLFADEAPINTVSESIPDTGRNQLLWLANKYIDGVHMKNPILDLSELNRSVAHVAENGLDWSTKTCLVTLVCAIGAIAQKYRDQHLSPTGQSIPGALLDLSMDSDCGPQLSTQFWTLAAKRLGLAIGGNDIQAVQCLCLAGIYHMHHMQPLQAWKYFSLAGTAWIAIVLTHSQSNESLLGNEDSKSFTLMQSLYFTIWKSECELKVEINFPGPFLNSVDFPRAFPSPPIPDPSSPAHEIAEGERIWYYYLAEIAVRHLINRIINATFIDKWPPTTRDIRNIVRRADVLESQVLEWQESLPSMFRFDIPTGFATTAHPDDLTQILRHRYLTCRELIARPFVRICIETSLNIDQRLRCRIEQLASEDVRFCMLKISQVAPHLHQGTWFGIRNLATAVLILSAVHMAKGCSWSTGAQEILLPADWRDKSLAAMDCFSPLWTMKGGGVSNIYAVLQKVLLSAHLA